MPHRTSFQYLDTFMAPNKKSSLKLSGWFLKVVRNISARSSVGSDEMGDPEELEIG